MQRRMCLRYVAVESCCVLFPRKPNAYQEVQAMDIRCLKSCWLVINADCNSVANLILGNRNFQVWSLPVAFLRIVKSQSSLETFTDQS